MSENEAIAEKIRLGKSMSITMWSIISTGKIACISRCREQYSYREHTEMSVTSDSLRRELDARDP